MALYNPSDFDFSYNERDLLPGQYVKTSAIEPIVENQQFILDRSVLIFSDIWKEHYDAAGTPFTEIGRYFIYNDMLGVTSTRQVWAFVLADSSDSTNPVPGPYSTVRIRAMNVSGGPLDLDCQIPAYLSLYWHGPFGPLSIRTDGEEEIRIFHDTTTCDQWSVVVGVSLFASLR